MIQFKLEKNKCIILVSGNNLYVSEHNSDIIKFYIPNIYEGIDMTNYIYTLQMILPDKTYCPVILNKESTYEDYTIYSIEVTNVMTQSAGDISMELSIIDSNNNSILKTNIFYLTVYDSIGIGDMSEEQINQIDWLTMEVDRLNKNKADNLHFDNDNNNLQLTANGELIGDPVSLPEGSGSDDIIIFGDDGESLPVPDYSDDIIEF